MPLKDKITDNLNVDAAKSAINFLNDNPAKIARKAKVSKLIGTMPYTDPSHFNPDTDVIARDLEGNPHIVRFGV